MTQSVPTETVTARAVAAVAAVVEQVAVRLVVAVAFEAVQSMQLLNLREAPVKVSRELATVVSVVVVVAAAAAAAEVEAGVRKLELLPAVAVVVCPPSGLYELGCRMQK